MKIRNLFIYIKFEHLKKKKNIFVYNNIVIYENECH